MKRRNIKRAKKTQQKKKKLIMKKQKESKQIKKKIAAKPQKKAAAKKIKKDKKPVKRELPKKVQPQKEPLSIQAGTASKEPGFTGPSSSWFDGKHIFLIPFIDKQYSKQLCADLAYQMNKDYYFGSYSHFSIHEEMLHDTIRTEAYEKAIRLNKNFFEGKTVLDVGAGTGVLSIFAARNGARRVYAIENAEIFHYAKKIIEVNSFRDKIELIQGKVEEVKGIPKVDIIISEWMGYFLLFESMLQSVLAARDKYLKKGGRMLPNQSKMFVAAIEDEKFKEKKINYWNKVYDIDMSCMKNAVLQEGIVEECDGPMIISDSFELINFDLENMKMKDVEFSVCYQLKVCRTGTIHGLVTWFDCIFSGMEKEIVLTTSPFKKATHWKQTLFFFAQEFKVKKGDIISGSMAVRKSIKNFRELDVKISFQLDNSSGKSSKFVQMYKVR